jgi:hypothetical protein
VIVGRRHPKIAVKSNLRIDELLAPGKKLLLPLLTLLEFVKLRSVRRILFFKSLEYRTTNSEYNCTNSNMKMTPHLVFALTLALTPAMALAQSAGQDMKDAGSSTKKATNKTGSAVAKGTDTAVDKTKEGGTTAVDKTKETSVKGYNRTKEGVEGIAHPDAAKRSKVKDRASETKTETKDNAKRAKQKAEDKANSPN